MFGGIGITSYRAKNALIDGLSKGQGLAKIAGGLLNEALGISNFVNTVTCYIIDAQTGIEMQLPVNPEKITVGEKDGDRQHPEPWRGRFYDRR